VIRRIFTSIAPTIITGIAGFITFASFLIPALAGWRVPMIGIAVIVAGVAIVMGFVHLIYIHIHRVRRGGVNAIFSVVLIAAAIITLIVLFISIVPPGNPALSRFIFDNIIVSTQSALGALLAVFLALAALRMLRRKRSVSAVWFLLSAVVVLITQIQLPVWIGADGKPNALGQVFLSARQVLDALTTGGMRGLLIGVGLGTLATAFRVLFFIDRPQSE
jgi:hypothetical protein